MIRFDRVTKLYPGTSRPALNAVDVEIRAGEFVFLVGASGSGKSSFLRLILKEEKPTAGEIHVLGQRLASISNRKVPYFRRKLGVVFQDFRLLPNRTVFQNVAFTLQVIGKSRGFIQEAVPDVLQMVGLAGKEERLPHELSGGEQQRVAIARAVVNKPAILLADEPTGNLDPATSQGIMQVLETINVSGTTVVMATHDVGIVDAMKRRVIELVGGEVVRDETEGGYTTSIPIVTPDEAARAGAVPVTAGQPSPSWCLGQRSSTSPVPVLLLEPAIATTPVQVPLAPPAQTAAAFAPPELRPAEVVQPATSAERAEVPEPAPAPTAASAASSAASSPEAERAAQAAGDERTAPENPAPAEVPARPVSTVDETTSPRAELPLAARLREAAGSPETDSLRLLLRGGESDAAAALPSDTLSLAARLGLRDDDEEPQRTSSQEVGPTS
ncbi:cell division ATP-binding protein FtsE [Naasia sp. SYSU D00948]|uniref:cell division ATP-binding protein FtsE n=1 Tax=Naasia sp. SYSU D00948 TaxID=2817379 RepID=UPI001B30B6B0|nr:cell division ATP-binding protein FtsE [Naasia sp. SYSU D00948]